MPVGLILNTETASTKTCAAFAEVTGPVPNLYILKVSVCASDLKFPIIIYFSIPVAVYMPEILFHLTVSFNIGLP